MKKIIVFLLVLFLSVSSSYAEEKKELTLDELQYDSFFEEAPMPEDIPVFKKFLKEDIKFIYLGETNSVDLWLTVKNNGVQVLTTTLDGRSLIVGAVYNGEGENLVLNHLMEHFPKVGEALYMISQKTVQESIAAERNYYKLKNQQMAKEVEKKEVVKALNVDDAIWQSLSGSSYVEEGNPNAPLVYVFSDVFCGHCTDLHSKLKTYTDKSIIRVRYITIGILSEASVKAALGILSSPNVSAAWKDYYNNGNANILRTVATDEGIDKFQKNLEIFDKWKLRGTPSLFYKSKSGGVKFLYGQPQNIEEFVNDISK